MALRPKVARERSRARARAPSYGQPRPGLAASPLTVAREEIACGAGVCPLGAARPGSIGTLRALTASHRNVPIETLDALALGPERRAQLAEALANAGLECLLLMTCNRSEIYWHSRDSRDLALIESAWREVTDCADPMFDRLVGREAARHLFRVGACQSQPMRKVRATNIGRVAKIGEDDLFFDLHALRVPLDQCGQRRFSARG